jgi:hypothetical protein
MAVKKATAAKKTTSPRKVAAARKAPATKKALPVKKAVAKTPVAAARRPEASRSAQKGDAYECAVCGLAVVVDEACGCEDFDIICCDQPMRERKSRSRSKAAVA